MSLPELHFEHKEALRLHNYLNTPPEKDGG